MLGFRKLGGLCCVVVFFYMPYAKAGPKSTVPQLVADIKKSESKKEQISLLKDLASRKDPRSKATLLAFLKKDIAPAQIIASQGLAALEASDAIRPLQGLIKKSKNRKVKKVAKQALTKINLAILNEEDPFSVQPKNKNRKSQKFSKSLYAIQLKSSLDNSSGLTEERFKKTRAKTLENLFVGEIASDTQFAFSPKKGKFNENYGLDIAIKQMDKTTTAEHVVVNCTVQMVVSNKRGKMLSLLTGGAKVTVKKESFETQFEKHMQKDAMESAVKNLHKKLSAYLSQNPV